MFFSSAEHQGRLFQSSTNPKPGSIKIFYSEEKTFSDGVHKVLGQGSEGTMDCIQQIRTRKAVKRILDLCYILQKLGGVEQQMEAAHHSLIKNMVRIDCDGLEGSLGDEKISNLRIFQKSENEYNKVVKSFEVSRASPVALIACYLRNIEGFCMICQLFQELESGVKLCIVLGFVNPSGDRVERRRARNSSFSDNNIGRGLKKGKNLYSEKVGDEELCLFVYHFVDNHRVIGVHCTLFGSVEPLKTSKSQKTQNLKKSSKSSTDRQKGLRLGEYKLILSGNGGELEPSTQNQKNHGSVSFGCQIYTYDPELNTTEYILYQDIKGDSLLTDGDLTKVYGLFDLESSFYQKKRARREIELLKKQLNNLENYQKLCQSRIEEMVGAYQLGGDLKDDCVIHDTSIADGVLVGDSQDQRTESSPRNDTSPSYLSKSKVVRRLVGGGIFEGAASMKRSTGLRREVDLYLLAQKVLSKI